MASARDQLMPSLTGRYWLLAALALVLAPHLLRLPLWLALGAAAVIGWRLLREMRGWPLPGKLVRITITLLAIGAVLAVYRTVLGRDPGTALLAVLLCLKLLELRTLRDCMVAIFLGYFLVVVGFLFDDSIFTGFYMFVVVLALTAALLALNHPAATFAHSRHYLKSSLLLLLQSVPLMVLLFILFPRINTPLWHMPDTSRQGRTGLSDELRMGEITNLADSDELVFRAEFKGKVPGPEQLYWRGPVMWLTDGRRWQPLPAQILAGFSDNPLATYKALGATVYYTVTLEPQKGNWLFALDLPTTLPLLDVGSQLRNDYQLLANRRLDERVRYSLRSAINYRTVGLDPREERYALRLPENANPRTLALAAQWREETPAAGALVERALAYFRSEDFYYTRQPPALGDNAVDEFLFDTQRGFCEHYASSFVTLMRAAGVPARIVTGYQGGEFNSVGNFIEVRQNRAHAWAEVWLPERGWVRVDPTSTVPSERVLSTQDTQRFASTSPVIAADSKFAFVRDGLLQLRLGWNAVGYAWNVWVIGFDAEKQRELLQKLGLGRLNWQGMIRLMFIAFASLLLIVALAVLYRRPRVTDPTLRHYRRFCRKLERAGVTCHAHEGPQQLGARARQQLPGHGLVIDEIIGCYVALRYARAPGDLIKLKRAVDRFRP